LEIKTEREKRDLITRLNHDQPLLCYIILCLKDLKMSIGNKDVVGQALFKHCDEVLGKRKKKKYSTILYVHLIYYENEQFY